LRALGAQPPNGLGRWIRCHNLHDPVRLISASTNAIVRIFPNDPGIRYRGRLHEYVAREGERTSLGATMTGIEILHYGYQPEIIAERNKGERNVRLSRAALESNPEDPAYVYNYAMSAMLDGNREVAREQLERVIVLTEQTPRGFRAQSLVTLSGIYTEEGRGAEALDLADRCVAILPSLPDAHYARGRALAALGRLHEARDAFGNAIANGARGAEHFVVDDEIPMWKAHSELAGTLVREKRYGEALRWIELALRNRPAERVLILNRARCWEALGDLGEALAGYRAAFDGFHDEGAAIDYVNFVLRHGSADIVATAVESALPLVGEDYRRAFLASVAGMMQRAGRTSEAEAWVRRVLAIGHDEAKGRGVVMAIAQFNGVPELTNLLVPTGPLADVPGGGPR
jgi:tetratricopeptide (TPR) repeat protein